MGRGLSDIQKTIMKVATEKGQVYPKDAIDAAFEYRFGGTWEAKKASASRALRRLCQRGLLKQHQCRYVRWPSFYHMPTVEPIERDEWWRSDAEREADFAKDRADQERRKSQPSAIEDAANAANEIGLAAMQGKD